MSSSVWVLCPNGHRVNVSTSPNTPLNSIKQQACEKQGFAPSKYGLRRESQKQSLDLSLPFRLSGIPNKAKLELIEEEQKVCEVNVALQLDVGGRTMGKVGSNFTLWETIQSLKTDIKSVTTVTYLQQRIPADKLKSTTLADLGAFKGSVMLRLQGVQVSTTEEKEEEEEETPAIQSIVSNPSVVTDSTASDVLMMTDQSSVEVVPGAGGEESEMSVMEVEEAQSMKLDIVDDEMKLVESKPILFNPGSNKTSAVEESDEFFEFNDRDLKLMLRDLHKISERELRLKKPEKEKEVPKQAVFRIRFPNGVFLQDVFNTSTASTDSLYSFVRGYLTEDSADNLSLYQAPPKKIIKPGLSLLEAGLTTTTLLHAGGPIVMQPELAVSSDTADVEKQLSAVLGTVKPREAVSEPVVTPGSNGAGGAGRPSSGNKNKKPVPKWFKLK